MKRSAYLSSLVATHEVVGSWAPASKLGGPFGVATGTWCQSPSRANPPMSSRLAVIGPTSPNPDARTTPRHLFTYHEMHHASSHEECPAPACAVRCARAACSSRTALSVDVCIFNPHVRPPLAGAPAPIA